MRAPLVRRASGCPPTGARPPRRAPLVRSVLAEAGLDALLNEALLLTTELSTNAVVHAGTELDIEVAADPGGLTVTVTDFAPGPVDAAGRRPAQRRRRTSARSPSAARPAAGRPLRQPLGHRARGRPARASGSGSTAPARPPAGDRPRRPRRPTPATAGHAPSVGAMTALLQIAPDRTPTTPLPDFATDLLARLAELVGAAGGVVRLDRGDGAGRQLLARYGRAAPRRRRRTLRVPLTVHRPYAGELELDAAPVGVRPAAGRARRRAALAAPGERPAAPGRPAPADLADVPGRGQRAARPVARRRPDDGADPAAGGAPARASGARCTPPTSGAGCSSPPPPTPTRRCCRSCTPCWPRPGPDSILARLREASRLRPQVPLGAPLEGFAVPLVARGQRLGTLAVGRHQRHRHDPDEVAVLEDVARRAALAIDNARIHDERRKVAQTLQQLAAAAGAAAWSTGIGFAAEYVPTGDGAEVGGDFYDVVPLADDRWLVVVGDVSGKGVQAAAVTGLVRDVIRVLVARRQAAAGDARPAQRHAGRARRRPLLHAGAGRGRPGVRTATLDVSPAPGRARPAGAGPRRRRDVASSATGGTALGLLDDDHLAGGAGARCARATR